MNESLKLSVKPDRITIDEKICNGKPTIRGKRIAVVI